MKVVLIVGGIVLAVVVAGAAILVVALPDGTLAALRPQPARTEVRIENAAVRDLIETVSAPGEIEPLTRIEISAEVASRIEELPVQEGDEVRRGDVIVRLDDRILSAALQSAEAMRDGERFRLQSERARLEGLRKTLEFARRTLERQQALHDSGDVSGAVLDEAMERVEDLEASVESATHTISVIESSL
ncbi:MAG: biotin/lipoyl-binding protein, partial [Candidatus Rokubacteria bacterium]|nr:biotin/lipoyl-binding protein [Candidatus Rokubacteria bacterium]